MDPDAPEIEQRLTQLQSQINRLSLSVHLWQGHQDRLFEQRLVAWNAVEARAQKDATERLHELQRTIEHEWSELRQVRDEPGHHVRLLEANLGERLSELSEQVHSAVLEMRAIATERPQALQATAPSWPLDEVVRLHDQLRDSDATAAGPGQALATRPLPVPMEAPGDVSQRLDTLERNVVERQAEHRVAIERDTRISRYGGTAIAVLGIGLVVAGLFVYQLRHDINAATARVSEAERQAQVATQNATERIGAAREAAERQITEARALAVKAQTISDVLASPDLVRYNLVGGNDESGPFNAQALWSRSSGFVFSGSRLPALPMNSIYQIWLLTTDGPRSAGTFVPDTNGRFSMATTTPPRVPPPMMGVFVTVERGSGGDRPTGRPVLARAQTP